MVLEERRRNLSDCMYGWDDCDRSKLDRQEAGEVDRAARARNLSECEAGRDGCDYVAPEPVGGRGTGGHGAPAEPTRRVGKAAATAIAPA